ncbi:stage III sporulation protein AA [Bacillaceae bacterium Marseille-Q3522]|nr:stage III sporulation protein AA [Bacillaceae bacterium Marseille-Q3522]
MKSILSFLPTTVADIVRKLPTEQFINTEEIRIRINRPVEISFKGKSQLLPYTATNEDAIQLLNKLSNHSIYTLEEELKQGYITIEGGHRVGLAGKVILEGGRVKALRNITSFNIRIAKEQIGIAIPLMPYLFDKGWMHTMIIGPPQTGKTTLLRDIARILSGDEKTGGCRRSYKVGIVDERSEITGSVNGIPQMTFGARIDVLDACPKAEGMMMMIRSMSPEILIVDEIGSFADGEAIMEAVHAGIKLIMTTHGTSLAEIRQRPSLRSIMSDKIFQRYIELGRLKGPGTIVSIKNRDGIELLHKASDVRC